MIVVSLGLILVAVTLLVLGLTAGSSSLLIASIAASLLAAIALVIGARRAAIARRADPVAFTDPVDLGPAEPVPGRRTRRAATDVTGRGDAPAGARYVETMTTGSTPSGAAETVAGPDHAEAAAYAAGRRDADEALVPYPDEPIPGFADGPAGRGDEQPDYDRAAGFIGGARAPEQPHDGIWADPAGAGAASGADEVTPAPAGSSAVPTDGSGLPEEHGLSEEQGLPEELGAADPDDPEDEPRPQVIRPGDAVRVARMDAEVLVVDGRPRYHLADCPHLIGRQTEGLPVAEAVELGFTPCGMCRPADRLVAAAARG
jgi:hypothetical protein